MTYTVQPVRIGSVKITPEELEVLGIRRDYKRLREAVEWSSSMIDKEVSVLTDLLGDKIVAKRRNERTPRQRQLPNDITPDTVIEQRKSLIPSRPSAAPSR